MNLLAPQIHFKKSAHTKQLPIQAHGLVQMFSPVPELDLTGNKPDRQLTVLIMIRLLHGWQSPNKYMHIPLILQSYKSSF